MRQQFVRVLRQHGFATLHVELLAASEAGNAELAHDVALLAERIAEVLDWAAEREDIGHLRVGLCAADVAAAAALCAATLRPARVVAVVARSGRPDLAGAALARVSAPTLLVVGGADPERVQLNRAAMPVLACEKRLEVVPGATRGFDEPGTREAVLHLAGAWFANHPAAAPTPN
ncbi:MAG: alpha/beta hydrolase [Rubrivivax sp.]|nr:alpha/beta hydrolase [Rubrivivax sp.]